MIPKYHYCLLPSGNSSEFPQIELRLKRLNIGADYSSGPAGGRCYRVPSDKIKRLPKDKGEPYLPVDDDRGHAMYPLSHEAISIWIKDFRLGSWIKL